MEGRKKIMEQTTGGSELKIKVVHSNGNFHLDFDIT